MPGLPALSPRDHNTPGASLDCRIKSIKSGNDEDKSYRARGRILRGYGFWPLGRPGTTPYGFATFFM